MRRCTAGVLQAHFRSALGGVHWVCCRCVEGGRSILVDRFYRQFLMAFHQDICKSVWHLHTYRRYRGHRYRGHPYMYILSVYIDALNYVLCFFCIISTALSLSMLKAKSHCYNFVQHHQILQLSSSPTCPQIP